MGSLGLNELTLYVLKCFDEAPKYIDIFHHFWDSKGPRDRKSRSCLSYLAKTMAADVLVTPGVRASAATISTWFSWNIPATGTAKSTLSTLHHFSVNSYIMNFQIHFTRLKCLSKVWFKFYINVYLNQCPMAKSTSCCRDNCMALNRWQAII